MISRKLPDEIIIYIMLEMEMADILRCLMVSKSLNTLVQTSSVIQYKIELASYGLVPCTNTSFSAAAAVCRLREQQDAWRRCEWKSEKRIELKASCRTYELRSGVWAFGHNDYLTDPTLPTDYTTTITCYSLPSATPSQGDDASGRQWTLSDLGVSIRDFTMDPLADLLVLLEQTPNTVECPFRVHFRRLSDGQPHALAAKPVLDFDMICTNRISCSFAVQLYGSQVGVLVRQDVDSGDYDYMAVWNWRVGVQELYMEAVTCSFDDFVFIDATKIMLAVLRHPVTLEVWKIDPEDMEDLEKPKPVFCGCFSMPLTTTENAYLDIHFDGSPSLSLAGAKTMDCTPFTPAPKPPIFAISFGVLETDPDVAEAVVTGFTMVMSPSLMLGILGEGEAVVLDWDEWGPECTRWLPQDQENFSWEPCSFGGRYAVVGPRHARGDAHDPAVHHDEPQVIRLFDFRPDVLARYKYTRQDDPGLCVHSTVVPKETLFAYDIVSRLPYHLATSEEISTPVSGVMIDEGRLVCTKSEDDDEWRTLLVLTF